MVMSALPAYPVAMGGGLLPASFRGVACYVESRKLSGGRRGPLHEFPDRDAPETEDTGRKARRFSVAAFVVGDNASEQAQAFEQALEEFGPGLWCDPWRGEVRVQTRDYTREDTVKALNYVAFTVSFDESAEDSTPLSTPDHRYRIKKSADGVAAASLAAFARDFSLVGLPGFAADDAVDGTAALLGVFGLDLGGGFDLAAALRGGFGPILAQTMVTNGAARRDVSPAAAATGWRTQAAVVRTAFAGPATTPVRRQQRQNHLALQNLGYDLALVEEAKALMEQRFDSADTAAAVRDDYQARLRAEGMRVSGGQGFDDGLAQACFDLAARVAADIDARAVRLPRLVTVQLPVTMPAVVAAHKYLGDASRCDDLTRRNRLPHPAFCPVVHTLEALP